MVRTLIDNDTCQHSGLNVEGSLSAHTRYIMQMSYLYTSDFPFKNFANSLNMQKQYEKNVWEKSNDTYSLLIKIQINHISICLLMTHTHCQ